MMPKGYSDIMLMERYCRSSFQVEETKGQKQPARHWQRLDLKSGKFEKSK